MSKLTFFIASITTLLSTIALAQQSGKAGKKQSNDDAMWVATDVANLPEGVTHHTFRSNSMKRDVGYSIFLPPSYAQHPNRRFPVIYHLHGAGGNETRSLLSAQVLQKGIIDGRWPELIIVFPNGGRSTMYQDSGDGRFMSETMMIKELIPHVDKTYRTVADRNGRCIEGFSMGGRGSTHLAMRYPQMFCSLFNQSGNVYRVSDASKRPNPYLGDDEQRLIDNDPYLNLDKNLDFIRKNLRIRLGCGTADPEHLTTVREFHQALLKAEVKHEYFEVEGLDHSQKKMIEGMEKTWFDFHIDSLKLNGIKLHYVSNSN